jgi:hypothetical protein
VKDAVLLLFVLMALNVVATISRFCVGCYLDRDVGSFGQWYGVCIILAVAYVLWLNKDAS